MTEQSFVFVVDDDEAVRETLAYLFQSIGIEVKTFASGPEFLQAKIPDNPSCLILDVRLPGVGGLDFQTELSNAKIQIPIIFMTGHGDIPMSVRAMKAGAVEFLTKPFRDQDMIDAVQIAHQKDRERREKEAANQKLKLNFETLTPREKDIMAFASSGFMNKQIAGELGISEITVKVHRGSLMRKLGAKTIADLVRMADALGVNQPKA